MKSNRLKWRKKAMKLAKEIVRSKGYCEWCKRENRLLHGAHIISARKTPTCADLDNIISLCYNCHLHKWHGGPWEAIEGKQWFETTWPGRYQRLKAKSETNGKGLDFESMHKELLTKAPK